MYDVQKYLPQSLLCHSQLALAEVQLSVPCYSVMMQMWMPCCSAAVVYVALVVEALVRGHASNLPW